MAYFDDWLNSQHKYPIYQGDPPTTESDYNARISFPEGVSRPSWSEVVAGVALQEVLSKRLRAYFSEDIQGLSLQLEKIYDDMMKSIDFHNYGHLVKYQQTRVYLNKVSDETNGVYHEKLPDAEVIEERELPSGNFVNKYALSENMIRFIRSLDNLYEVDFEYEYAQAQDRLKKSQAQFKEAEDSGAEVIVVKKLSDRVDYDQTLLNDTQNFSLRN